MGSLAGRLYSKPSLIRCQPILCFAVNTKRDKLIPDGHHQIEGETITGKIIEIGTGEFVDFIYGGTVLDDCEIRILCGAQSVQIFNATIRNSIIKTRRELKSLQLLDVHFDGCKFLGKYSGCRFGQLTPQNTGTIVNCDFSAARLDLCDFYSGADIDSLVFPPWLSFTPSRLVIDNQAEHRPRAGGDHGFVIRSFGLTRSRVHTSVAVFPSLDFHV